MRTSVGWLAVFIIMKGTPTRPIFSPPILPNMITARFRCNARVNDRGIRPFDFLLWTSRCKLSNDGYHNNGQRPNEADGSEAKQGQKRSYASCLEQINRNDDGGGEENKTIVVVAKRSVAFLSIGGHPKRDDEWECNSR